MVTQMNTFYLTSTDIENTWPILPFNVLCVIDLYNYTFDNNKNNNNNNNNMFSQHNMCKYYNIVIKTYM